MLGWMSTRVLGQYDLLVIEDDKPEDQDIVYYVAPNVLSLENKYAFDPAQFRLWLALHEVTHRAQFTGVDWMRPHFIGLVESVLDSVDPDPKRVAAGGRRASSRPGATAGGPAGRRRRDGAVRLGGPDRRRSTSWLGADEPARRPRRCGTMDRAGEGLIPSAPRFASGDAQPPRVGARDSPR